MLLDALLLAQCATPTPTRTRTRSLTQASTPGPTPLPPALARCDFLLNTYPPPLPLARCDFLLKSASAVAEFALWVTPSLQSRHLDLQVSDRFASQTLPAWTRRLGPPAAVADLFCERLHEACANETAYMYRGRRYCHHCNAKGST